MYHRPIDFAIDELMIAPSAIADGGGKYVLFTGWVIDKSTWKELLDKDPGLQPLGPLLHELPDPPPQPARELAEMQRMERRDTQESEEEEEAEDEMRSEPESEDASSERA